MATVIRVKRPLVEEPEDTLIINCKKRKTDIGGTNNDVSTVFKRTATLNNQTDDIFKHIKESTKHKIEQNYKSHDIDLRSKMKIQNQAVKKNLRYTVVNLHRSIETSELENDYTIVDVETGNNDEQKECVYDLYCSESTNLPEIELKELISIYPLGDELVYDASGYEHEIDDDDSDSNDENNWRNDYPDESDHDSITEGDMIGAMKRVTIDEEDELSSDGDDERFVYSVDDEYDESVRKLGKTYNKFKATNDSDQDEQEDER